MARFLALAVIGGLALGIILAIVFGAGGPKVLLAARFPRSGLVTNEYAYYHSSSPLAEHSRDWVTTSGSLFGRDGVGWTGVPDGGLPDPGSVSATDSAVFRLRTTRADFENVAVTFRLRLLRLVTTARTPPQAYDGVHVWLRYQSPDWLYFASVSRRDGRIVIGKKLPTASGGRYADIARVPNHPLPLGQWQSVRVTIESVHGAVTIRVLVNGRLVARAVDDGNHGTAILRPGRVGVRGDNADFEFGDFKVTSV